MRLTGFIILCLLLVLPGAQAALALDFNAFWLYRTSGGEGRETRSEFQERYTLGVGPQLDWRPTHAITATAGVGYNRTQRDSGSGTVRTEEVTPSASLNLNNDIFSLGLAGDVSKTSGNSIETTTGNSWDATLASRWNIPFWPGFRFNYGQRDEGSDNSNLFERSERIQTSGSAAVNWDLRVLQLDYNYSTTQDEDRSSGDRIDSDSHFLRGQTDGSLLNNRVSFRLSQQYQTTDSSGLQSGALPLSFGIAKFDDELPTDPDYRDPDEPAADADATSPEPPLPIHIQFRNTGFEQQVDVIRLDYNPFQGEERPPLLWDLYQRDFAGVWTLVGVITGTDVADEGYVELPIGREAEELLLVSRDDATRLPPAIAYRLLSGELLQTDAISTNLLTNAGVNIDLTRTLRASLNASLDQLDGESFSVLKTITGDQLTDAERESQRRTLSGRLVWSPFHWITPSLGYSETTEDAQTWQLGESETGKTETLRDTDRLNRTYSLTITTRPTTTVTVTFGVTKTETTTEEDSHTKSQGGDDRVIRDREGDGMRYSVTTSAQLYPDLNTSLFIAYTEQEEYALETSNRNNLEPESSRQELESESFSIRSNFNARLRSDVTADLTTNFRNGKQRRWDPEQIDAEPDEDSPGETKSSTADTTLVLSYRPSSYLSLRGFYTTYFLDSTQDDRMGAGMSLALLRTTKTRVTLEYDAVYSDDLSQRVGVNGSWNISRALSLQARTNYNLAETDFYSAQVSLNLRL